MDMFFSDWSAVLRRESLAALMACAGVLTRSLIRLLRPAGGRRPADFVPAFSSPEVSCSPEAREGLYAGGKVSALGVLGWLGPLVGPEGSSSARRDEGSTGWRRLMAVSSVVRQ